MDCCKPEDDNEKEGHHGGGCCGGGTSGCGLKMWIMIGIIIVAIWYFRQ